MLEKAFMAKLLCDEISGALRHERFSESTRQLPKEWDIKGGGLAS